MKMTVLSLLYLLIYVWQVSWMLQQYRQRIESGAVVLFFIQVFSTFSFAVLNSTMVLYLTRYLEFTDIMATGVAATFLAFNYALHLLGGYIGGRFMSYRGLFCLGMILQTIACILLYQSGVHESSLYWALALFLTGSGFNVTCINCMLTQLFSPQDRRRETAFYWNYSGMNVGFFAGGWIAGLFDQAHDLGHLYLYSSIANVCAFLIALGFYKQLRDQETLYLRAQNKVKRIMAGLVIVVLVLGLNRLALVHANLSDFLVILLGLLMGAVLIYLARSCGETDARERMYAFGILVLAGLCFFTLFLMMPMGLTLFIERNVDRSLWGQVLPPEYFMNIDPLIVVFLGPILAHGLKKMRDIGCPVDVPKLFSIALILIGLSMFMLALGIEHSDLKGYTHLNWVVIAYVFLSLGELFLSPVGYAVVGQLVPERWRGLMMGLWLMMTGVAASFAHYFSQQAEQITSSVSPLVTNDNYLYVFIELGCIACVFGWMLLLFRPRVISMMHARVRVERSKLN
jgi:proton-dependent oligopeptide transporter, POT family